MSTGLMVTCQWMLKVEHTRAGTHGCSPTTTSQVAQSLAIKLRHQRQGFGCQLHFLYERLLKEGCEPHLLLKPFDAGWWRVSLALRNSHTKECCYWSLLLLLFLTFFPVYQSTIQVKHLNSHSFLHLVRDRRTTETIIFIVPQTTAIGMI